MAAWPSAGRGRTAAATSVGRARVRFGVRRKGGRDSVSEGEDGVEGEGVVEVSRTSPRRGAEQEVAGVDLPAQDTQVSAWQEEEDKGILPITPCLFYFPQNH
jgi:hypothetical protein